MAEKDENLKVRSQRSYQGKSKNTYKQNTGNGNQIKEVVKQTEDTCVSNHPGHEEVDCLTCCEPIKYFSVSECGHTSICSMCVIRMRVLFDELECPLCKVAQNIVVFTSNPNATFAELMQNKDTMIYDRQCKAYFDDVNYEKEVQKLWELKCSVCSSVFPTIHQLSSHVKGTHNLQHCKICLENQKVFFCEKVLYTAEELSLHNKNGDKTRNIKPHPSCDFCKKVFFSEENLYYHCKDSHETCFICDRQNVRFQYFRDYKHLENHFRSAHHLCPEQNCITARFVAFSSAFELKAHTVSVHSQNMTREQQQAARQIEVNFTVRREGSDRNRPSQPQPNPTRNITETPSLPEGAIKFNPDDYGDIVKVPSSNGLNNSNEISSSNVINNRLNNLSQNISNEDRMERNVELKNKILSFFDGDQSLLNNIMKKTKTYLDGQMTVADFHNLMIRTFGESDNGTAIYDEMVILFPKKNKSSQDDIINYRQKLSQTQTVFPSLSEMTPTSTAKSTTDRTPQGANYKNIIGANTNSKQIVGSSFPSLQTTNPPTSEPKKDPDLRIYSNLPGAGRGQKKLTPQQRKQEEIHQKQAQEQRQLIEQQFLIEQQIKDMQPSFGEKNDDGNKVKQTNSSGGFNNSGGGGQGGQGKGRGKKQKQVVMSWG